MKEKTFYIMLLSITIAGLLSTAILTGYTVAKRNSMSITAYISNEDKW